MLIRTLCITRELRSELDRRTGDLVSHPDWSDDQFRMGNSASILRLVDEHFGSAK
jgi:hypothetical protein